MKAKCLSRVMTKGLVLLAFVLIVYLFYKSWGAIVEMIRSAKWESLSLSLAALALANIGVAYVFTQVVQRYVAEKIVSRQFSGSFLLSQVGKYIPGKIWGVAMQAALLRNPRTTQAVLLANVELVVANMVMVTSTGIGLAAWQRFGFPIGLMMLIAAWLFCAEATRLGAISHVCRRAIHAIPRLKRRFGFGSDSAGATAVKMSPVVVYGGVLLFIVMYSFGWWLLVVATTGLDALLCLGIVAALSLSYIIGVVSMMPAGIGAREAVLVLLAPVTGVAHVDMAAIAITSRVAILFVDAISACVGALLLGSALSWRARDV